MLVNVVCRWVGGFYYILLVFSAANSILGTLLVGADDGDDWDDGIALAKQLVKIGNVSDRNDSNGLDLFGSGRVAAVEFAVGTTVVLAGYVGNGSGDSGESEDDSLGEHLERLLVGWLVGG